MTGSFEEHIVRPREKNNAFLADIVEHDGVVYLVGGTNREPTLLVSSDGVHFHKRKVPPRTLGLRAMAAVENEVFVCGEYGAIYATADRGVTWTPRETDTRGCLFSIRRDAAGTMWCCGDDGVVLRSTDGGRSFAKVDAGTTSRIQNIVVDGATVLFCCSDGVLLAYRDGTFAKVFTGTGPLTDAARTKHGLFVCGDGGQVYRSDGETFVPVEVVGKDVDLEAMAVVGDTVFVVGARGTVLSSSDGKTFALHKTSVTDHLYSAMASGHGVFIGGEGGSLLHLRDAADTTWADRKDTLGNEERSLDATFRNADPDAFLTETLPTMVEGIDLKAAAGWEKDFETVWGTKMPTEIVAFLKAVEKDAGKVLYEFRPENGVLANPPEDENLFEEVVKRDQEGYLGTALVETLAGVLYLGTYGNGDSHLVDVYGETAFKGGAVEPGGARKTLIFDHEEYSLSFETGTSLSRFAYFSALTKALVDENLSASAATDGFAKVRGTIAPSWHFTYRLKEGGIEEFGRFEDKAPISRMWFARALWLIYLLRTDGVVDVERTKDLFFPGHNPPLVGEQHAKWLRSAPSFVPTALYCMLRGFFFDDATLPEYLAVGRKHTSRLVRDCAKVVDELLAGTRTSLGRIADVAGMKKRFQALDLDPARAEARQAEAEAKKAALEKARAEARTRVAEVKDPVAAAWADVEDIATHEAVEARLRAEPALKATFAAVDFYLGQKFVRENLVLKHEGMEELEWLGLHGDTAVLPLLVGALLRPIAPKSEDESDEEKRVVLTASHPNQVGDVLAAFAERGRLDARAIPALRKVLTMQEKYEFRRAHAVNLLGWLHDKESVPALEALVPTIRTEDYGEALAKKDLGVALAKAFGRLGDPRGVAPLTSMVTAKDRVAKDTASWAAVALAELGAVDAWRDLLTTASSADRTPKAWILWSVGQLAAKADDATKKAIAAETAKLTVADFNVLIAATVRARCGEPPDNLGALVEEAFTKPAYNADRTKANEVWALRAIGVTNVDSRFAKAFVLRDDHELRTAAREALNLRGQSVPPARLLHRNEVARIEAEGGANALLAAFNDETSVYRHVVASRLGELKVTSARDALLRHVKGIADATPRDVGASLGSDPGYPLRWSLKALLELGPAPETTALLGELLVHPSRDVKDPVLRYADGLPDDPGLILPMLKVVEEKYGWMESTASKWLEGAKTRHPAAYEAALETLRQC